MPISFEYFTLTGPISNATGVLKHVPALGTGILVDSLQGPPQKIGLDWGITGSDITFNIPGSAIRSVRESYIKDGGPESEGPTIRVIYEY